MTRYVLLIQGDEDAWAAMSEEEQELLQAGHRGFAAAAGAALVGGHELQRGSRATTVRVGGEGVPVATDGPFAETREVVGGFYLVEAADIAEVVELAAHLRETSVGHSGVEIREVVAP